MNGRYADGNLGPRTWRDPKTGFLLWHLLAIFSALVVLPPFLIAAIYVAARCG